MAELLRVEALSAGYGEARVISNLDFALEDGKSLALLGRNGVGKTTLLNALIGVTARHGGRIALGGADLTSLPPHRRALRGIGWAPQERNIFRSLTRRRKSHRHRDAGSVERRACLRDVSAPSGASSQHGSPIVRRRAADARDRTRVGAQSAAAVARRTDRRVWRRSSSTNCSARCEISPAAGCP